MYRTFSKVRSTYLKYLQALSIRVNYTNWPFRFYIHLKLVGQVARADSNVARQRVYNDKLPNEQLDYN